MVERAHSLPDLFFRRAAATPDLTALRVRGADGWQSTSWSSLEARVVDLAAGVLSAWAPEPGERVAVMASTRAEWVVADWALLSLGLESVAIHPTLSLEETGYLLQETGARFVVVDNPTAWERLRPLREGFTFQGRAWPAGAVRLEAALVFDDDGEAPDRLTLAEAERLGGARREATRVEREARLAALTPEGTVTVAYTSGTTGPPKGCVQTHANHLAVLAAVGHLGFFPPEVTDSGVLLFLPLAHSFARMIEFAACAHGAPLLISEVARLQEDLTETRPGVLPAVPLLLRRMHDSVMQQVEAAPPLRRALSRRALDVAARAVPFRERGEPLPPLLSLQLGLARRLVTDRIRAALGLDRVACVLSGSAPLDRGVLEFFHGIGVPLMEGYGLTETTPVVACNGVDAWRLGTVGRPLPGVEVRLDDDGELLVRGPNVFEGYLDRPDATAEVFTPDGWLRTGDVVTLDAQGFITLVDRKLHLIKTASGHRVIPGRVEALLEAMGPVERAVVAGEGRPWCVALVTLTGVDDPDGPLVDEAMGARLLQELRPRMAELPRQEQVRAVIALRHAFTVDNGLITGSFKLRRRAVLEHHRALLDRVYAELA